MHGRKNIKLYNVRGCYRHNSKEPRYCMLVKTREDMPQKAFQTKFVITYIWGFERGHRIREQM